MKNLAFIFIFFIGLGFGILTSDYFKGRENIEPEVMVASEHELQQFNRAKEQFQQISQDDYQEYIHLKTLEEKYKKADEILGKILIIFLSDLGIKLNSEQIEYAKSTQNHSSPTNIEASKPVKANVVQPQPTPNNASPKTQVVYKAPWAQAEKDLEFANTPERADEFLKKVAIPDFKTALFEAKPFSKSREDLREIVGNYQGSALISESGKHWEITFSLRGRIRDGELQGRNRIVISENGKVFSNGSGSGKLHNFQSFSQSSEAFIIGVSPTLFFQAYYIKANENIIANIYRKSNGDKYSLIGTAHLKKN